MRTLKDLFQVLNKKKKYLTPEDLSEAFEILSELSQSDLVTLLRIVKSQPLLGVDTAFLAGTVIGKLTSLGVDVDSIPPIKEEDLYQIIGARLENLKIDPSSKPIPLAIVTADYGVRNRREYSLPRKVRGIYQKSRGSQKEVDVVGVCFTTRFGMPPFVSSLLVLPVKEESEPEKPKKPLLISEKSFYATSKNWQKLLEELHQFSHQTFKTERLCVREPFARALLSGSLITDFYQIFSAGKKKKIILRRKPS